MGTERISVSGVVLEDEVVEEAVGGARERKESEVCRTRQRQGPEGRKLVK